MAIATSTASFDAHFARLASKVNSANATATVTATATATASYRRVDPATARF